jgi:hypothetical protein
MCKILFHFGKSGVKALIVSALVFFAMFSLHARPDAVSNTAPDVPTLSQGPAAPPPPVPVDNTLANHRQRWYLGTIMVAMLGIAAWYLCQRKPERVGNINPS